MNLQASQHAYDRAKKRFKWKPETLDKMMAKAYHEGIRHSQTKGSLKKYISGLYLRYKKANNIRIYGQNVYLFRNKKLITLYRIDNSLIKYLK